MSELNKKYCEVCGGEIPNEFVNLLCYSCYDRQVHENELKKKEEAEDKENRPATIVSPAVDEPSGKAAESLETASNNDAGSGEQTSPLTNINNLQLLSVDGSIPSPSAYNVNGITDPEYIENSEQEDKNQVATNWNQFLKSGKLLWHDQRNMYTFIKDYSVQKAIGHPQYPKFVWKPNIVDVGCGSGVGSNILSQEAHFVWGIDKNKLSIDFAKEAFTRVKNNIYYSSQVNFDQFDFLEDNREVMRFDIVIAVEVIEHIYDYKKFLTNLIQKFNKRDKHNNWFTADPTEYFISTPNRNNEKIDKKQPWNKYHVREWTKSEYLAILSEYFHKVDFYDTKGNPQTDINSDETPILAKCSMPKL